MGPESPSLSTGCKVAHFSLMHSVCEDCYRFAFDLGVIKKKVQQNTDCLVSQTLGGLNESPNIYIQIMQKRYETQHNMYM